MSELRSVIDAFRADELAGLPDARLEEDFAELHRAAELLEAERLRRLAEIARRGIFQRDGHLSAASWLALGSRSGTGPRVGRWRWRGTSSRCRRPVVRWRRGTSR